MNEERWEVERIVMGGYGTALLRYRIRSGPRDIAVLTGSQAKEDAERIVACVNASVGMATEEIEQLRFSLHQRPGG